MRRYTLSAYCFFEFCGFINKMKNDLFCPPTLEIKISMCLDCLKINFFGIEQSWAITQGNTEMPSLDILTLDALKSKY